MECRFIGGKVSWKYIKLTEDVLLHFPEAMLFHYIFNYNQIE